MDSLLRSLSPVLLHVFLVLSLYDALFISCFFLSKVLVFMLFGPSGNEGRGVSVLSRDRQMH